MICSQSARRRLSLVFLLSLLFCEVSENAVAAQGPQRKTVAVVLSGGGAKGMAHIGALKVIREAGIPIDYVVGTSMGAIIGGLYAIGYSPEQLDSLVRSQDWTVLLSDKQSRRSQTFTERRDDARYIYSLSLSSDRFDTPLQGVVTGRNLDMMFQRLTFGYHSAISFDSLSAARYACVATNAVDGSEYVFHRGVLSQAMRASMSIPGVFSPVRKDSMVLVDGGLVNNYPADVARKMGADIIIGVMFQNDTPKASDIKSVTQVLAQIVNIATRKKLHENEALSNLVLHVNVHGLTTASFTHEAIDSLIHYGEDCARSKWDSLVAIRKSIGIMPDSIAQGAAYRFRPHADGVMPSASRQVLFVRELVFEGISPAEIAVIQRRCHLKAGMPITVTGIEEAERIMYDELSYSYVTYSLSEVSDGYRLTFHLKERQALGLRFGVRLDNEEIASLLVGATLSFRTRTPSSISLTGRLGRRDYGRLDYSLQPSRRRRFDAYYLFEYNDINLYDHGSRSYNVVYNLHRLSAEWAVSPHRDWQWTTGVDFSYYYYRDLLLRSITDRSVHSQHLFSYRCRVDYDTYDKAYFPSEGIQGSVAYAIHTDDLYRYRRHSPYASLAYAFCPVVRLSDNGLALLPSLYGRSLFGSEAAYASSNCLGGTVPGRYESQQLPFPGMGHIELVRSHSVNTILCLRQRIASRHFLSINGALGMLGDHFYSLLRQRFLYGCSANYGFDSMFGPLSASLGYCTYTRSVSFYIDLGMYF